MCVRAENKKHARVSCFGPHKRQVLRAVGSSLALQIQVWQRVGVHVSPNVAFPQLLWWSASRQILQVRGRFGRPHFVRSGNVAAVVIEAKLVT